MDAYCEHALSGLRADHYQSGAQCGKKSAAAAAGKRLFLMRKVCRRRQLGCLRLEVCYRYAVLDNK